MKNITISGVGCCLVDYVYNNISFASNAFSKYSSKRKGDGGLVPGRLVFVEEFESFTGLDFQAAIKNITSGKPPDMINIGGPCIVPLIHAAQMLNDSEIKFNFYGKGGQDETGCYLLSKFKKTPVRFENYHLKESKTPTSIVLSDPEYDNGSGERIFINSIGAAWDYSPEDLDEDFYSAEVVVFGGTALVPLIHDHLTELLEVAKSKGCITIVNTVYDFRNEKANPTQKWPLGKNDSSYQNIDLLMVDYEEALRLSGKRSINSAMQFFRDKGTGSVIITNGSQNIHAFSIKGGLFGEIDDLEMPVSNIISKEIQKGHDGDTTGCGDNFVGGVIASLVAQLKNNIQPLDLAEACAWGVVSGGFTCFYIGGTYFEKERGEKKRLIAPYYQNYKKQIMP